MQKPELEGRSAVVREETAEELALVVSPQLHRDTAALWPALAGVGASWSDQTPLLPDSEAEHDVSHVSTVTVATDCSEVQPGSNVTSISIEAEPAPCFRPRQAGPEHDNQVQHDQISI